MLSIPVYLFPSSLFLPLARNDRKFVRGARRAVTISRKARDSSTQALPDWLRPYPQQPQESALRKNAHSALFTWRQRFHHSKRPVALLNPLVLAAALHPNPSPSPPTDRSTDRCTQRAHQRRVAWHTHAGPRDDEEDLPAKVSLSKTDVLRRVVLEHCTSADGLTLVWYSGVPAKARSVRRLLSAECF